jgi:hypothetical protein
MGEKSTNNTHSSQFKLPIFDVTISRLSHNTSNLLHGAGNLIIELAYFQARYFCFAIIK